MSLLDATTDDVVVYPEELVIDVDGNKRTRAAEIGIPTRARLQIKGQSGTSSRRQEQDNEGFESEKVYNIRFPRKWTLVLGAQSQIEWNGERWAMFGDVNRFNNSPRTRHHNYTIKRY